MADNWLTFSEVIPSLTAEEEAWINEQTEGVAVVDGKEYPYCLGEDEIDVGGKKIPVEKAEFSGCRAYRDMEGYDSGTYRYEIGFEYEIRDDRDPPEGWGRHLWLFTEEVANSISWRIWCRHSCGVPAQ